MAAPGKGTERGRKGFWMSAFVVSTRHIDVLVRAALDANMDAWKSAPFAWYPGAMPPRYLHPQADALRDAPGYEGLRTPSELGSILLAENAASVGYRYDDPDVAVPDYTFTDPGREFSPGEVFKAIDCLNYQSCEHPYWRSSEAHAVLTSLRNAYCQMADGYDDTPWGF